MVVVEGVGYRVNSREWVLCGFRGVYISSSWLSRFLVGWSLVVMKVGGVEIGTTGQCWRFQENEG